MFKEEDVDLSKPLIASCMTGMTATALAFALNIIGVKNVPIYYVNTCDFLIKSDMIFNFFS